MKNNIMKILRTILNNIARKKYNKQYKNLLKHNNIANLPCPEENKWVEKWKSLGKFNNVEYRLFSHYIGNDVNIIPEVLCKNVIEPILNPMKFRGYYTDKNIFDRLFKSGVLPKTIFRRMNGFYYDAEYSRMALQNTEQLQFLLVNNAEKIIVIKPTIETSSGKGVKLFGNDDGKWKDLESGDILTLEYLNINYDDFIVQECLEQADFMSYYNPTSVNTLRLTLYRSVETDECHIPNARIRIGKNGSLVDNAHAGGGMVGIKSDGTLCNKVFNQYGESTTMFNNIDFSQEHKIPNWDIIVEFAKYIGKQLLHMRLISLDIMIDKTGTPRLIEFNCNSYSVWAAQFTLGPALGEYTDEVIKYCKSNIEKAQKVIRL